MTSFDVVVVGAGPAGSSTALHLVRREGVRPDRVLVLDKARFPRDKPCAGAVSQLGVDLLRDLGVPIVVPSVELRGVRVLRRRGDETEVGESTCVVGLVARRSELDASLLDAARASGVVVRDGVGVEGITRDAGGFTVVTSEGDAVRARFLAGCDGAGSVTRRLFGFTEPARKGHLYVLETPLVASDDGPVRGFADFDLTVLVDGVSGYYWDFPTVIDGARCVSRGIYHANLTRERVDVKGALARALVRRGIDPEAVTPRPFATRPYVRGAPIVAEGLLLVGEAAGIDRATGEGIAQALVMGEIAARHLARALRIGVSSFEAYAREVSTSTTGRHMRQSAWLAERVYGPEGEPARRLLLRSGYARRAAMCWYRGETLPYATKARLGVELALHALA